MSYSLKKAVALEARFADEPDVIAAIKRIKRYPGGYKTTAYDISDVCNLRCEGCYYFMSEYGDERPKQPTEEECRAFFASEVARGVNAPVFAGAEPSMKQDIIRIGMEYWNNGIICTNGLEPIAKDIPYRIIISTWGNEELTKELRGNGGYDKSMEVASGDKRVVFMYTFNAKNIEAAYDVAKDCHENDVKICFSQYSPTEQYIQSLKSGNENDNKFYRISNKEDNLCLTPEDRLRVHEVICDLIDSYPKTVIYSKTFSKWVTKAESLYKTDPVTGLATNCATLNAEYHKHYLLDLSPYDRKHCATPSLDCDGCRVYPSAFAQYLATVNKKSEDGMRDWLEVRDVLGRLYIVDWDDE